MKCQSDRHISAVWRFSKWLEAPSPPYTLALGATCGCDLPRIERETCETLNRIRDLGGYRFSWFDCQDTRHLAGQPAVRRFIVERAGLDADGFARWNDHEVTLRGFASLGGLVLGGRAAMDASRDLPNVCRLMISRGPAAEPGLGGVINLNHCGGDAAVDEIVRLFLDWMARRAGGGWKPRRSIRVPEPVQEVVKPRQAVRETVRV